MSDGSTSSPGISHYFKLLRRRWKLVAIIVVAAVGTSAALTFTQDKVYRASMKIVVGQGEGIFLPEAGNVADQFTQTMSDLLNSHVVASGVIDRLNLGIEPEDLLADLAVSAEPLTAVLEVSYDSENRVQALDTLEEVGAVFTELVDERLVPDSATTPSPAGADVAVSATVFDAAHILPDPVAPRPSLNLAVALMLGVMLGVGLVLLQDRLDDTVRTVADAEEAFGQSATASMPPGFLGFRPLGPPDPKLLDPVLAELAIQRLRASIMWSWGSGGARSIAVTSGNPEEGKTSISASLSVALAREGYDVVIVDGDLRRPVLASYLPLTGQPSRSGLDAVMRGDVDPVDALVEVPIRSGAAGGRLRAIVASPDDVVPSEFEMERTSEVLRSLLQLADYVIVDTPPIHVVTDAYALVAATDTVIGVVRAGSSTGAATEALSRAFAKLRVRSVRRAELVVTEVEAPFMTDYSSYTPVDASGAGALEPPGDPGSGAPHPAEITEEELGD